MNIQDKLIDLYQSLPSMPIHTPVYSQIPSQYGRFPKNLTEYSQMVDKKFIDNNQYLIEDIFTLQPEKIVDLLEYQNKYFSAILTKERIYKWIKEHPNEPMIRGSGMGGTRGYFVNFGKQLGPTIEVNNNSSHATGFTGVIHAYVKTGFTTGGYYDQAAMNFFDGQGNHRLCTYTDSAGVPNTIISGSETGSVAAVTGYNWITSGITEYQITDSTIHIADQVSSSSADIYRNASVARYTKTQAYGAFTTTGFASDTASGLNLKIGHS